MILKNKYPALFQLFVGYFYDAEFEDLSDQQIITEFISECSSKELEDTKNQLDRIILDINMWREVSLETNIYFQNSEEALEWLRIIKDEIKKHQTE